MIVYYFYLCQEADTAQLLCELDAIQRTNPSTTQSNSHCTSLRTANAKLHYRVEHLKKVPHLIHSLCVLRLPSAMIECCILTQSTTEAEAIQMKHMTNVCGVVSGLFQTAVRSLYPAYQPLKSGVQQSGRFGDYQCTMAMPISKVALLNCVCSQVIIRCTDCRCLEDKVLIWHLVMWQPI